MQAAIEMDPLEYEPVRRTLEPVGLLLCGAAQLSYGACRRPKVELAQPQQVLHEGPRRVVRVDRLNRSDVGGSRGDGEPLCARRRMHEKRSGPVELDID